MLGGLRHFLGPIFGAIVFVGLEDVALIWTRYYNMAMGVMLIAVVFAFPSGLAGAGRALADSMRRPRKD